MEVMDMGKACHYTSIHSSKIEAAEYAGSPMILEAIFSCAWVSLVSVDQNTLNISLVIPGIARNLFRQPNLIRVVLSRFRQQHLLSYRNQLIRSSQSIGNLDDPIQQGGRFRRQFADATSGLNIELRVRDEA